MPKNYHLHLKGYVGDWNFSRDMVAYILDKYKDAEVTVLIDSLGGRVDTALSISALFKNHGNVHCHYVGMNASAATIASMGAKKVTIDANALFLVHKCMVAVLEWDYMNADELSDHIAKLEKTKKDNETIDACIAGTYASRCKKSKEDLLALMKEGAWLTAKETKEWGFVDEITDDAEDEAPVITDTVADALAKQGIPLPNLKRDSFMSQLLKFFTGLKPSQAEPAPAPQPPTKTENMATKSFTAIGAALGSDVEASLNEGNLTLTEDQADALEAALANNKQQVDDLTAQVADLNAKVADLLKEPAATTTTVNDASKDENPLDAVDVDKVAAALLNMIP